MRSDGLHGGEATPPVEVRGLEPLTSGLQSRRSSQLSYTPTGTVADGPGRRTTRQPPEGANRRWKTRWWAHVDSNHGPPPYQGGALAD